MLILSDLDLKIVMLAAESAIPISASIMLTLLELDLKQTMLAMKS